MPDPTEIPNTHGRTTMNESPDQRPGTRPSEKPPHQSPDGKGGSYEKEGSLPAKGNEMPGIDERIDEELPDNERIKIIHDPKRDNEDLDAYTDRVKGIEPEDTNPDNAIAPKS